MLYSERNLFNKRSFWIRVSYTIKANLVGNLRTDIMSRETREGRPPLTVETEVNGDSKSTNERGPSSLYQERSAFGKMKMDPAKRAQTQNTGEVSSLEWFFPNLFN
jgi:hypothetical protein